jgi:AhpD family alkylhydroperoxidase
MTARTFSKRIYTLPDFKAALIDISDHLDGLRHAARGDRVGKAFAEKIMLAVSKVNGCRYCLYGHSRAALAAGVGPEEIRKLLAGDLGTFPEQEAVALAFAQHYATCQSRPDPATWQRLVDYYGLETARDIRAYLRMITFGNLFGNTFDALLSRLAGKPAEGSSLWSELGVLLGGFVILPVEMLGRFIKRLFTRSKQTGSNLNLVEE